MNLNQIPMIQCPACNKAVSEKAVHCPTCGHPIRQTIQGDRRRIVMHKISRSVLTIFAKALNLCEGNDVLSAKLILKTIFKNFLKTAIIVVACLCIGLAKSMLGSMPLYADKMEQQTYFILEGLLSGLMWWTNMGLISKLFGRKRLLFVSWSLFLFYSVISIIFNVLTFVKMQLISEEEPMFLMAYFAFVFSPWLILALSFKPRKPQTSKPES